MAWDAKVVAATTVNEPADGAGAPTGVLSIPPLKMALPLGPAMVAVVEPER